ncbi:hypothetical protein PS918_00634 [Pseudomonas fluorescens]|uniref:DUF6531 domain-containing protein n=1 Tax=Pseudomonas fluorescens TaxID=294 RepID=A0A5E7R9U4_PSEFL|nr:DUF6531 domain-containing protein [Pseudomonas fluorescens]VVP67813.1 hypothetical protein PS918_00634 [Pseudomonas fluorescens]
MRFIKFLRVPVLLLITFSAFSVLGNETGVEGVVVDPKNGNLSVLVVDTTWPGSGWDIRVMRTYNSLSDHVGYFGKGWCSNLETQLFVLPEGNALVVECGAGQAVLYGTLGEADDRIVKAVNAWSSDVLGEAGADDNLRSRLMYDHLLRWKWAKEKNVQFLPEPEGRLYEYGRGLNYLIKTPTGHELYESGQVTSFDSEGHLTKIRDNQGNVLLFNYSGGKLVLIEAENGLSAAVERGENGLVSSVKSGAKSVRYTYRNNKLILVSAPDKTIKYEYTPAGKLSSYSKAKGELVKFKINGDTSRIDELAAAGCLQKLAYPDKIDPDGSYRVKRNSLCKGKNEADETVYEYRVKINTLGTRRILASSRVIAGADVVDVNYHPIYQRPIFVKTVSDEYHYTFSAGGRVSEVTMGQVSRKYEYDQNCGAISHVVDDRGSFQFSYDAQCNLSRVESPYGQLMLRYDQKGRIAAISDSSTGKAALVSYEPRFGKPAIVESPGLGKISVSYKADGTIDKVDSADGPSVAMSVAGIFNNLVDITSPATAELPGVERSQIGQNCRCSVESFFEPQ